VRDLFGFWLPRRSRRTAVDQAFHPAGERVLFGAAFEIGAKIDWLALHGQVMKKRLYTNVVASTPPER